jgi:hypothetical protein
MQPFPPAANGGPSQANPPAAKQPAAPIPLPHPRPPQAGPRPQGGLLAPMYPTPKTPKDYDPGNFDPRISPPPLMMPSDGWRRPDLENAWLSPSWSTDVPTTPAPPLLDENGTLERSGMNVPDLLDRTIGQESSANPYEGQDSGNRVYDDRSDDNPHATSSMWRKRDKSQAVPTSALGAGQFLDDTWLGYLKKYQSDVIRNNPWLPASVRSNPNLLTKDQARAAGLMDMRTNYEMAYRATKTLAEENAGRLQRAGVPLTPLNVYIAHFLGANTAIALLQADSSTPAAQVAPKAARSNSILRGRTVGEAISEINHDFMKRRRMPFR